MGCKSTTCLGSRCDTVGKSDIDLSYHTTLLI